MDNSVTFVLAGAERKVGNPYRQCTSEKELVKEFVLVYPILKPAHRLNLVLPRSSSNEYKLLEFMSKSTPNVFLYDTLANVLTTDINVVAETANTYKKNGLLSPSDLDVNFLQDPLFDVDLESDLGFTKSDLKKLEKASLNWGFNVHEYSSNELLAILFIIFKGYLNNSNDQGSKSHNSQSTELHGSDNAGSIPVISDRELMWFLCICRILYKSYAPYHSFWHCVDVAQFSHMLLSNPNPWELTRKEKFHTVIAAAGHDILHPGLNYKVICGIDPSFKSKYKNLEEYHINTLGRLVTQLLPQIASSQKITHEAIAATNLEMHCKLTCQAPTFVHVLKMSDFACTVRPGYGPHYATSVLIFLEFRNEYDIRSMLDVSTGFKLIFNPHIPEAEALIDLQISFMTNMIVPYFKWLAECFPPFERHHASALLKLQRFESMKRSKSFGFCENYPLLGMVSCGKVSHKEGAGAAR